MMAGFSPGSGFIVFCYKYIVVVISLLATDFKLKVLNINIYCGGPHSNYFQYLKIKIFLVSESGIFSLEKIRQNPADLQLYKSSLNVHPSLQETPYQQIPSPASECL